MTSNYKKNGFPTELAFRAMLAGSGIVLLLVLCVIAVRPTASEPFAVTSAVRSLLHPDPETGPRHLPFSRRHEATEKSSSRNRAIALSRLSAAHSARPDDVQRARRITSANGVGSRFVGLGDPYHNDPTSASWPDRTDFSTYSGSYEAAAAVKLQPPATNEDETEQPGEVQFVSLPNPAAASERSEPSGLPVVKADRSKNGSQTAASGTSGRPAVSKHSLSAHPASQPSGSAKTVILSEPPQEGRFDVSGSSRGPALVGSSPAAGPPSQSTRASSGGASSGLSASRVNENMPAADEAEQPEQQSARQQVVKAVAGLGPDASEKAAAGEQIADATRIASLPQSAGKASESAYTGTGQTPALSESVGEKPAGLSSGGSAVTPDKRRTRTRLLSSAAHTRTSADTSDSSAQHADQPALQETFEAVDRPQNAEPEPSEPSRTAAMPTIRSAQMGQAAESADQQRQPTEAVLPPDKATQQVTRSQQQASGRLFQIESASGHPDRYSLRFQDADIREVLRMLGQLMGVNVLISQGVQGTSPAASLEGVTLEEAFNALVRAMDYVCVREGKFWYVFTQAEAEARKKAEQKLVVRVYRPHYISVADLQALVTPLITPNVGKIAVTNPNEIGLQVDSESAGGDRLAQPDALLVQDYPSVIEKIDQVIAEMDVPPLQVAIEAEILSVRLDDDLSLGVNFALLDGSAQTLGLSGNGARLDGAGAFPNGGYKDFSNTAALAEFLADAAGLKFGIIHGDVGAFIRALERIADTNLIAAPHLRVVNKQKAELMIGTELSYKTLAFNDNQTVENVQFLEAGTKLVIRPFISPDGYIRLEVHPERSSATINKTTGLPDKVTTQVTTNILVRDQETIVIGGLIEEQVETTYEQVPVLGDLPWVGAAFRNKTETVNRHELIVLLTPRIVWDAATIPAKQPDGRQLPGAGRNSKATRPESDRDLTFQTAGRGSSYVRNRSRPPLSDAAKAVDKPSRSTTPGKPFRVLAQVGTSGRLPTGAERERPARCPGDRGGLFRLIKPIRLQSAVPGETEP